MNASEREAAIRIQNKGRNKEAIKMLRKMSIGKICKNSWYLFIDNIAALRNNLMLNDEIIMSFRNISELPFNSFQKRSNILKSINPMYYLIA